MMMSSDGLVAGFANSLARITIRLRIALFAIAAVTALAGLLAIVQGRTILTAYEELSGTAQPLLALVQRTETELKDMTVLLQNLPRLIDASALETLNDDLVAHSARLQANLLELREFEAADPLIGRLEQQVEAAQKSASDAIETRITYLERKADLNRVIDRITILQREGRPILEDMAFNMSRRTDILLRSASEADSPEQIESLDTQLAVVFQASLALGDIGFSLDTVVNTAVGVRDLNGAALPERSVLLVKEELEDIIGSLAHFPQSASRLELAQRIQDLRTLVVGPDGIFERQRELNLLRQTFETQQTRHMPALSEISEMATGLVSTSLAIVNQSSEELRKALQNLIWILIGMLVLSVGTIVFTNSVIIENQFGQRMRRLIASVRAISGGDLNHVVTVAGRDEISEMAGALNVFKGNAQELRRSNVELEKFAYVAAHDLRSPLRAINDLSCWIIEDDENDLSPESQAYLTLLQERTDRLDRLLRDLLAYARVGQSDPDPEDIELKDFVTDQAHLADPDKRFNIQYDGPDILIRTQMTLLQQVLSNLLANAVRHHDRDRGKIVVRAKASADHLHLEIQDDGPGIPPQYQDQIFELFQTLQPRDEVEGSGLGLAIVKKIVDRQKGSINLISDPDKCRGTTFRIILPLSQETLGAADRPVRAAA